MIDELRMTFCEGVLDFFNSFNPEAGYDYLLIRKMPGSGLNNMALNIDLPM